jgi:hypothetical protein
MRADRIDHCGLLTDEQMARAVEHQAALLLGRLGRRVTANLRRSTIPDSCHL